MESRLNEEKKIYMEEEFDNFLKKVSEIEGIVKGLSSSDKHTSERAKVLADDILHGKFPNERPSGMPCRYNRTVVNQKAFDRMGKDGGDPAEMSKDAFMSEIERDAEARAKDRQERKERADTLKMRGNAAFKRGDYDAALVLFDEAIDHVKDSCVLYENRALSCLHLQLYTRVVEDCDWALRLDEDSLKATLYKARALHCLADYEGSRRCVQDAMEKHEKHKEVILRYVKSWGGEKTPDSDRLDSSSN